MNLPSIRLNSEAISSLGDALGKEWILTNGLGGYASSTVLSINTRKYHGLLIAALNPPRERTVCLAKLDEQLETAGNTFPLFTNELQDGIYPRGHLFLKKFSVSPLPEFVYEVQNVRVQKTIFMLHGKNAVVAIYILLNGNEEEVKTRIFPIVNCRSIHETTDKCKSFRGLTRESGKKEAILKFENPKCTLAVAATNGDYVSSGKWIERICYREEAARGESFLDDCYQTGYFEMAVEAGEAEKFAVVAIADKNDCYVRKFLEGQSLTLHNIEIMQKREESRCIDLISKFHEKNQGISPEDWLNWAILALDKFIVGDASNMRKYVIAGYPWFEVWGRDTFISMPGLMLVTCRFEDARKVFLTFKEHCGNGFILNLLSEISGQPAYNSVDAPLWFVNAVLQYLKYTGDFNFVRKQLWSMLKANVDGFIEGAVPGVNVDDDGLVYHEAQFTWMDAMVDGQPATPRRGKAVEIQALWFNALKIMELLADKYSETSKAEEYARLAENAKNSFVNKFWSSESNYLVDVIDEGVKDYSLRPNQIFAVSLEFTMLDKNRNGKIVDAVHEALLTPYGLRTLAKNDPKYAGFCIGDRRSRDKAYHNGTVWSWLLGPFTTAFLKVKGSTKYMREQALNFLTPLFTEQIYNAGLGVISEIFDGEPPHTPRGCIAQAWSLAEPIRAYVEDVLQIRPRNEAEVIKRFNPE